MVVALLPNDADDHEDRRRSHARSTRRQPTLGPTVASQTQSISSRHRFLAQPVTAQPIEPILVPEVTDPICRLPLTTSV